MILSNPATTVSIMVSPARSSARVGSAGLANVIAGMLNGVIGMFAILALGSLVLVRGPGSFYTKSDNRRLKSLISTSSTSIYIG